MTDLYTITLRNKKLISVFDPQGNKTGEREEFVNQVIADLPMRTVNTYKKMFPDSFVGFELQVPDRRNSKKTTYKTKGKGKPVTVKTDKQLETAPTGMSKGPITVKGSGQGYSQVVNDMIKEAS
ncbi:MAG: hypothetical protein JJ979_03535 [Roseibium sp.]|nr:hypothetical protein [Roseibium sp.]